MDTSKDLVALLKNLSEGINKNDFDDYNESQVSQQFVIPILEKHQKCQRGLSSVRSRRW